LFTLFIIQRRFLAGFAVILPVATRTYHTSKMKSRSVLANGNGSLQQIGHLQNDPFPFDCYHTDGRLKQRNISFETKPKHSSQSASTGVQQKSLTSWRLTNKY